MNSDELDRLLDQALGSYTAADAPAGIEQRVMNRVLAPPRVWWRWMTPAGAIAAALLCGLLLRPKTIPTKRAFAVEPPGPVNVLRPRPALEPAPSRTKQAKQTPRPLPKLPEFPSRTPMSAEERALLLLLTSAPAQLSALSTEPFRPIEIEPIQIQPLEGGS